jgi:uncharacterized membrane protein
MRFVPQTIFFVSMAVWIMFLFGFPIAPVRGVSAIYCDRIVLIVSILATSLMTFRVVDGALLNERFIKELMRHETKWPRGTAKKFGRGDFDDSDVSPYLDVKLIVWRTRVVGKEIYLPFLVLFIMVISRCSYFANWSWPVGLILVLGLTAAIAMVGALTLRYAAEWARDMSLKELEKRRQIYLNDNITSKVDDIQKMIDEIKAEREGAFSILSQYPWLAAILLPSGGIGVWALLEYFAKSVGS